MRETMCDAPGVGLAAPHVGLALQLAAIEDREELLKTLPEHELLSKERKPVASTNAPRSVVVWVSG